MEWPNELVLDFLQYYENEPIIWNPMHPNHKNRNDVFDAWKRIEHQMGNNFSVTELKRKKDSLMASFRTCVKKVKDSSKSGAGTDDIYKPNWFAFETMARFLQDKNVPRETLTSEVAIEEQSQPERNVNPTENAPTANREEPGKGNEAIVLPPRATPSPAAPSFKPPPTKKSKTADDVEIRKKMDSAFNTLQSLQSKKEKHLCDIYGELVAAKLKGLDESTREICMHRIDNILFEMRMNPAPSTSRNQFFGQQSTSSSTSEISSPSPNEAFTLYTVQNDANELRTIGETVVVLSDNSTDPTLENYFS